MEKGEQAKPGGKQGTAEILRTTYIGAAVNVLLSVAKMAAGFACSSQALVADAFHSLSDLFTDAAIAIGVRYWAMPADEDHPYGHGKIEGAVTAFVGLMLAFAAFEICLGGAKALAAGEAKRPGLAAFCVALASVAAKELLFRKTRAVARRYGSAATEANAWHHRSDAISSLPVAVAIAIAHFFPSLGWLDPVGAIIVGAFIMRVAWIVAKPAFMQLTDAHCAEADDAIRRIALGVAGVRGVHQIRTRRYGGSIQADLHVKVARDVSVVDGHAIGHAVKAAVLAGGIGVSDATIHVEPEDGAAPRPKWRPIVGTLAFIVDGGKTLMVHRTFKGDDENHGKWNGIGGKVEIGESVEEGMRREIKEETGLEVKSMKLRGTVVWRDFGPKKEDWLAFVFLVDRFSGTPFEASDEGRLSWVPIEEIPSLPMWKGDALFMPLVFDGDERPFHGFMRYDGDEPAEWRVSR